MKATITIIIDTDAAENHHALEVMAVHDSDDEEDKKVVKKLAQVLGKVIDDFVVSWTGRETTGLYEQSVQ